MERKVCIPCGEEKPLSDFPVDRSRPSGRHPYCKPCKASYMREANARWKAKNPDAYKRSTKRTNLRKKFGRDMTLERYEAMLAAQGGRCLICEDEPDPLSLAVDHCHTTGEVRGLLCAPCNLGLGHFRDDPALLASAAAYLRR